MAVQNSHKSLRGYNLHSPSRELIEQTTGVALAGLRCVTQVGGFGNNYPLVRLSNGTSDVVWGITEQTIAHTSAGYITTLGFLINVNTSSWIVGTRLYCANDGTGTLTDTTNGQSIATVMVQDIFTGVLYINALSIAVAPTANSYSESFLIADWIGTIGVDEYFTLDITHGLGTLSPQVEIWEGDTKIQIDRIQRIDNNNIRLYVLTNPDCRFNGRVIIIK